MMRSFRALKRGSMYYIKVVEDEKGLLTKMAL